MAAVSRKHLVDGRWVTVDEMAEALGLNRQQIYGVMSSRKCSLQVAVNLVRSGQILRGGTRTITYMVDGRWMTLRDVAGMLGVSLHAVRNYRYAHPRRNGQPMLMQEVVERYRNGEVRHGGSEPRQHRVGKRLMTTADAANQLGIKQAQIQWYMSTHKASLAQTIRYYERKKQREAEREILRILKGV